MYNHRILEGDASEQLRMLDAGSARCCVTSPPYWGLRDYGVEGQLGLEETPEEYVEKLVAVFRDVRRVLADNGTLWLNLGDSYNSGTTAVSKPGNGAVGGWTNSDQVGRRRVDAPSLKPKDLVGIPWMVAFALRADGWYLRSDIIWHKPNPMPESVTDRPTKAHEYIFLLSKSARYFYDADAIREAVSESSVERWKGDTTPKNPAHGSSEQSVHGEQSFGTPNLGRNRRSVWTVATQPYADAHFATFPPKLIEPCILAGSALGDTVLDPFVGSGTTGLVSSRLFRDFIGIELNPEYAEMARRRIADDMPLFSTVQSDTKEAVQEVLPI